MDFPPFCPYCQSRDVVPRATGLKIFGAIGIVVGAAGAFKASLKALQVLQSGSVALPGIALTVATTWFSHVRCWSSTVTSPKWRAMSWKLQVYSRQAANFGPWHAQVSLQP